MADSKETILARLLGNISNDYDKSEGSFFYDAEMPVAIELETGYSELEAILNKCFADTATGTYLDRIVAEQGLTRKSPTKATTTVRITGAVGSTIDIGDKSASDTVSFVATESKVVGPNGTVDVVVECEVAGTTGNVIAGTIKYFPITITGLTAVTNLSDVTNGYDTETDAALRQRYYEKVQTPATSGNKYHYLNWAKEVTGVGDAKIFPLALGNGTVKVIIVNSNKRAADSTLINAVTSHIEENKPIGATVTVISATEKTIGISVTLTIDTNNYTVGGITTAIENALTQYFKDIAFKETYVSYAKIGNLIFDVAGVLDYSSLLVNGGTSNITLGDEDIPVLGGVVIG